MMQREVAERVAAVPGGRDFGLLSATAQTHATAEISGVARDPDQSVVAGAAVTLRNEQLKVVTSVVTANDGAYAFHAVAPGVYELTGEKTGFAPVVQRSFAVGPNEVISRDLAQGAERMGW